MSVKHALSRGLELGRSLFQLGILKPAGRIATKLRGERLRVSQPGRSVQPRTFLPARYRYYRTSIGDLAAQLQSAGVRRMMGVGSPRNRAFFLAFGVGLGLIDQQLDEDRRSAATCQEIQVLVGQHPATILFISIKMLAGPTGIFISSVFTSKHCHKAASQRYIDASYNLRNL